MCDCEYENCGCSSDCVPCAPVNCVQQAVNDALAQEKETLEGYVTDAAESASDAANSATEAKGYRDETKEFRDQAEVASNVATDAVPKITDAVITIQETADAVKQMGENLEEQIKNYLDDVSFLPWVYNNGSANGGEASVIIELDGGTVIGIASVYVNGNRQHEDLRFAFDSATQTLTLADPLEHEDELIAFVSTEKASPDATNIDNYRHVAWLYNQGVAVGGETVLTPPYTFRLVPAIYINGLRKVVGLHYQPQANNTITLKTPLVSGDVVQVILGGTPDEFYAQADAIMSTLAQNDGATKIGTATGETLATVLESKTIPWVAGSIVHSGLQSVIYAGESYNYLGALPHTLGVSPSLDGGLYPVGSWVSVGSTSLRSELAIPNQGAGLIANVMTFLNTTQDIKTTVVSALTQSITTFAYNATGVKSKGLFLRNSLYDSPTNAGKDWVTLGDTNAVPVVYDAEGKAFVLQPVQGYYSLENLGGGNGLDDADLMELSQKISNAPVKLVNGKTYYFSHPVKHYSNAGWIGWATFKSTASSAFFPFISSTKTAQNADNDLVHGTTTVSNTLISGVTIDMGYTDITGGAGFMYAENTLDAWTNCSFEYVQIANSKFDVLALQNACTHVKFLNCLFYRAGEDSVTIRKTCDFITFDTCQIEKTALVAHPNSGNAKFGDGIVVKGKNVTIVNCLFKDVGNGIKGAAVANNAEDNDTPYQASYLIVDKCRFQDCYGGIGAGTVNAAMISAGLFIEGLVITNNIFINTAANVVGLRYLRNVILSNNEMIKQNLSSYHSVELINVIDLNGVANSVRTANGGAMLVSNCTGFINLIATDVSKLNALNSLVVTNCDGMDVKVKINTSGRTACTVDNFSNGTIDLQAKNVALAGAVINIFRRSRLNVMLTQVGNNGITATALNESTIIGDLFDAGTVTAGTFIPLRLVSGSASEVHVKSASGATNKPNYDIQLEAGISGLALYSTATAGTLGKINVIAGATYTHIQNL